MRPIIRGPVPSDENGNSKVFTAYGNARRDLTNRIGWYCSYCERKISSSLAIEHVRPKDANPDLELEWDNFLLACVNCNSIKGSENIDTADYYWPDVHNTYRAIDYKVPGYVLPAENATCDQDMASRTIDLTGLDVININEGATDTRFEERLDTFNMAEDVLNTYESTNPAVRNLDMVILLARASGFWSVWMYVFRNHPDVQFELINAFPNTYALCLHTDIDKN